MKILNLFLLFIISQFAFAQADYFYPNTGNFNKNIPSPEEFLNYPIGTHHTRHDKVVEYFKELARLSERMT
ncbi:MAG TPA: hypothetical protein PKC24_12640, partial [Cyclobacteriaceae bacterium]|nr:hypothetical protein [Cyclobacteriaceae bacterium]